MYSYPLSTTNQNNSRFIKFITSNNTKTLKTADINKPFRRFIIESLAFRDGNGREVLQVSRHCDS